MRPLPSSTPQPSDRLSASLFDLPGALQPELDDASLLSLLMTRTLPQRDIPRAVETLLKVFGSVAAVVAADPPELARAASLNATTITDLKLLQQLSVRLARSEACRRPVVSSWSCLIAYVRSALAHAPREQFRALYLDRKNVLLRDEFLAEGANNTILDNLHIYTAFSALDPLTQDKVSKLTGSVLETRTSRSSPAGLAAGRSSVSRSQIERPLLEPGEVRALPDDIQLVFAAGARPLRTTKLLYDVREPFRTRAREVAPDQATRLDAPPGAPSPWTGRRSLGEDVEASLPLFKEVAAAMDDKKVAARVADIYGRVAQEMAAQDAALDHLRGLGDG